MTAVSNAAPEIFPNNTPSVFYNNLPQIIRGQYEVSLRTIIFPAEYNNIDTTLNALTIRIPKNLISLETNRKRRAAAAFYTRNPEHFPSIPAKPEPKKPKSADVNPLSVAITPVTIPVPETSDLEKTILAGVNQIQAAKPSFNSESDKRDQDNVETSVPKTSPPTSSDPVPVNAGNSPVEVLASTADANENLHSQLETCTRENKNIQDRHLVDLVNTINSTNAAHASATATLISTVNIESSNQKKRLTHCTNIKNRTENRLNNAQKVITQLHADIQNLKSSQNEELDQLKNEQQKECDLAKDALMSKHAQALEALEQNHETEKNTLKEKFDQQQKATSSENVQALAKLKSDHTVQLNKIEMQHAKALNNLQAFHEKSLNDMEKQYDLTYNPKPSIEHEVEQPKDEITIKIPPGYYSNAQKLIDLIQAYVSNALKSWKISEDGIVFYYKSNKNRTQINLKYGLQIEWITELGSLLGFEDPVLAQSALSKYEISLDAAKNFFFVYLNVIEEQIYGHFKSRILKIVPINRIPGQAHIVYENRVSDYVPLSYNDFRVLKIVIRDAAGQVVKFNRGVTRVQLHFKKLSP